MAEHMPPQDVERLLVNMHRVDPEIAKNIRDRLELVTFYYEQSQTFFNELQALKDKHGLNKKTGNRPPREPHSESSIVWK
jgi:hypothetical protein